jgi:DNA-binding SARP family transcriptional activator
MDGATGAGTPELEVRLLGPIEVGRAGTPVALGGPKPRALLAALALEAGRVVSVDRLVESLWPGDPPETAAHAVQVYVSQLRKALGPVLETRAPGYELALAPEHIDVHRFTRLAHEGRAALAAGDPVAAEGALREALALWRGSALADFLYEPFAQNEIARLEELRTVVLEERIDADLALGRHAELVSELEALVQAQPLRERPRAQLMLALYRSGRQADALAAYRAAREILVDELGIDPGPELRELEAAILRQDDSLLLDEAPLVRPPMQFRRLVTILFVDVVESMALAEALDPEALGRVLQRYFETVSAALLRHGGSVEKYAGDAVMAAFGIPVSHEDDALRAARAALDIRAGIAALNDQLAQQHGVVLAIRIGIETGEVVATPTDARQRLVTGEAVGIAAKLEAAAGADEIVVGELAGRLIDHAAALEPLGEIAIRGKREPVQAYRLVELGPVAPAFEQRQEARLVGRKRELAALRRVLKRSADGSEVRATVVVGTPGVGKSRLAAELSVRAKDVTVLWGRCLSYGDGITYSPVRAVLEQAGESPEREAVLEALEADTPLPAPEIAWLFRQFCEATARERPLVLVFDDIHWAEPTFLELLEHIVDKGTGAIAVVCLARAELLEDRPSFLEGRAKAGRIELEALATDETDALLDGLGGAVLESDQRTRIVEAAEGNPLFLEQLLALALEGGLSERALPETVQALLAARLDRLGPGERAVLERGAVIGKEFRLDDVVALIDPEAASTTEVHMNVLASRGFLRPSASGEFRFRHVLVQEAVYRAAPKRLRAELHERFIDRVEARQEGSADIDEFAGYHFEQAYRLRTELGESDRRTERLGEDAGRRLAAAGARATKRGDAPAAISFFRRAAGISSLPASLSAEVQTELGMTLRVGGELEESNDVLERAIELASAAGDRRVEFRARMESAFVRVMLLSETGDELLEITKDAIPVFEGAGDDRSLGRALSLAGWMEGGRRGQHQKRLDAAERALIHYRRSMWPASPAIGEIANALYFGPTPVTHAIERCQELTRTENLDRNGRANVDVCMGGLVAQTGDFDHARALIASARATYEDLGQRAFATTYGAAMLGDVEVLAGDLVSAEATFRWLCGELERVQAYSQLASRAGDLAETLYGLGRLDEASEWVHLGQSHSASDDVDARVLWMPVRAKLLARSGNHDAAVATASDAVDLVDTTDALNRRASVHRDMGDVLLMAGRAGEAASSFELAIRLYEQKGNVVGAARVRSLVQDLALV